MPLSGEIVIVSSTPIFTAALQSWLEHNLDDFCCRRLDAGSLAALRDIAPDAILLLVPQEWRELGDWLPTLETTSSAHPVLVLADLRLPGMFLSCLTTRHCTLVAPGAEPNRLRDALLLLIEGIELFPPIRLVSHYSRGLGLSPENEPVTFTQREVECGCAVSLGATNRQIALTLHLGLGTVKNHVHALMQKLAITRREEAYAWFAPPSSALPHPLGRSLRNSITAEPPPSRRRRRPGSARR